MKNKDHNKEFEYRIITKDGDEKRLLSPTELFIDDDNPDIELDKIFQSLKEKQLHRSTAGDLQDFQAINAALYRIADEAHSAEDMEQFFGKIHHIINSLVYAENFFVALYEKENQAIVFPYMIDTSSNINLNELAELPIETLNKTLTWHMLQSGQMLHADAELMNKLTRRGVIHEVGDDSHEWLGFPLKIGKQIIGALVIQSYDTNESYSEKDIELLTFVSQHVATALSRKQSDDALRVSEKKLREVLENASVISYKFNLTLNKYEYVSNNIKFIFGFTSKEYLDMAFEDAKERIHPEDRAYYREHFINLIEKTKLDNNYIIPVVEYRWLHNLDRKYHWYSDTRRVICDDNKQPIAIIGSVRDITDSKKSEEKIRKIEDELHKMQDIENIGVLAAGLAHDFNNILTGIFGNISLAKMKIDSEHPGFKYLEKSEKSMNRATRLTRQLLTFSKGGEPVKEDVVLTKLIEDTTLFDLSGSNVKPFFDFSKASLEAKVDKGQIQQVISNLVINADQAMPDGGNLYIDVENINIINGQGPAIKNGRYIKIVIKDEGAGIDKTSYDRIFDPYFTTKEKGSGLGLTTVYSIIKKHDGHITVESKPGKGTVFIIYLPATETTADKSVTTGKKTVAIANKHKVMVMDDDQDILNLVTTILEMNNFVVATSLDGKQMLESYQNAMDKSEPFEAVIMDLTIPGGMGGKEAVEELLKIDDNAKCIVSSGYADDPIMAHYQEYGFKAAISKPFALDNLNNILLDIIQS